MQKRAAEALEAAKRHSQVYDQKMKEASLHQSRHAELWHEAQMYAPSLHGLAWGWLLLPVCLLQGLRALCGRCPALIPEISERCLRCLSGLRQGHQVGSSAAKHCCS